MNPRFLDDDPVPFVPPTPMYFAAIAGKTNFVRGSYEHIMKEANGNPANIALLYECGPEQKVITAFAAK